MRRSKRERSGERRGGGRRKEGGSDQRKKTTDFNAEDGVQCGWGSEVRGCEI